MIKRLLIFILLLNIGFVLASETRINVGETINYQFEGKAYEIILNGISDTDTPQASITLNGETKTFLAEQTKKMAGIEFYCKEIFRSGDNSGYVVFELKNATLEDISEESGTRINVLETINYQFEGKAYEIILNGISDTDTPQASITLNGETKTFLAEQTKKMAGIEFYCKEIFRSVDNSGYVVFELKKSSNSVCNNVKDLSCTLYLNENVSFEKGSNSYLLSVESIFKYSERNSAMIKVVNKKNTLEYLSYTLGLNFNFSFKNVIIKLNEVNSDNVKVTIFENANLPIVYSCSHNNRDYYKKWNTYISYIDADGNEIIPSGLEYSREDYCENENELIKFYCDEGIKSIRYSCPFGCNDGACIKVKPEKTQPIDMEDKIKQIENNTEKEEVRETFENLCQGCVLDTKCYPYGFRKDKNYCNDKDNKFVVQSGPDSSCQNNFECDSNLCIDSKCVSGSLWAKIVRFFSNLFGK